MSSSSGCPVCQCGDVRRIHRIGWQSWIPRLRAYRCKACAHQFVRFGKRAVRFEESLEERAATGAERDSKFSPQFQS